MVISYEEIMSKLPETKQEEIRAGTKRLLEEYPAHNQYENAKELAYVQLAKELNISQDEIDRLEKQSDLMLSVIRSHVETMGGKLTLIVEFPELVPVTLDGLGYDDVYVEDIVQQGTDKESSQPAILRLDRQKATIMQGQGR